MAERIIDQYADSRNEETNIINSNDIIGQKEIGEVDNSDVQLYHPKPKRFVSPTFNEDLDTLSEAAELTRTASSVYSRHEEIDQAEQIEQNIVNEKDIVLDMSSMDHSLRQDVELPEENVKVQTSSRHSHHASNGSNGSKKSSILEPHPTQYEEKIGPRPYMIKKMIHQ